MWAEMTMASREQKNLPPIDVTSGGPGAFRISARQVQTQLYRSPPLRTGYMTENPSHAPELARLCRRFKTYNVVRHWKHGIRMQQTVKNIVSPKYQRR